GRSNVFVKKLEASGVINLQTLKPRQGLRAVVPSPTGKSDAVVVAGVDDEGTLAAAMELAARLPKLWTMTGATIAALEDQTRSFLATNGIPATNLHVPNHGTGTDRLGVEPGARTEVAQPWQCSHHRCRRRRERKVGSPRPGASLRDEPARAHAADRAERTGARFAGPERARRRSGHGIGE